MLRAIDFSDPVGELLPLFRRNPFDTALFSRKFFASQENVQLSFGLGELDSAAFCQRMVKREKLGKRGIASAALQVSVHFIINYGDIPHTEVRG